MPASDHCITRKAGKIISQPLMLRKAAYTDHPPCFCTKYEQHFSAGYSNPHLLSYLIEIFGASKLSTTIISDSLRKTFADFG